MCQRPAIKSEASRCLCPFVGGPAIKGDAGFYGVCKRFKTPFKPPPREPPLTYRPGLMLFFCFFRWRVYAVCLAFTGGPLLPFWRRAAPGAHAADLNISLAKFAKNNVLTRGAAPIISCFTGTRKIGYSWNTRTQHISVYVPKIRAATSEETSIPTSESRFSPAVSN